MLFLFCFTFIEIKKIQKKKISKKSRIFDHLNDHSQKTSRYPQPYDQSTFPDIFPTHWWPDGARFHQSNQKPSKHK